MKRKGIFGLAASATVGFLFVFLIVSIIASFNDYSNFSVLYFLIAGAAVIGFFYVFSITKRNWLTYVVSMILCSVILGAGFIYVGGYLNAIITTYMILIIAYCISVYLLSLLYVTIMSILYEQVK